jgi:hypothetical protein
VGTGTEEMPTKFRLGNITLNIILETRFNKYIFCHSLRYLRGIIREKYAVSLIWGTSWSKN